MVLLRSPWFPLVCGTALLVLGIVARVIGGEFIASVLLTLSVPLVFEGGAWLGAAKVGPLYYDLDERVIYSEAYDPRAALVRYAIICGLLFSILIAREAEALPNSLGAWVTLVLIGLLWLAYVVRSYVQQIATLARQKNVPLSLPPENRR